MAINFCPNCGEKLIDGEERCSACGEAVPRGLIFGTASKENSGAFEAGTNFEASPSASAPLSARPSGQVPEGAQSAKAESFAKASTGEDGNNDPSLPPADLSGFDVYAIDPGVAPHERIISPPDRTDVMTPIKGMRSASEYYAPQEKKSHLGVPIKIAAVIAALLLAAAGIGLLAQPQTQQEIQDRLDATNSSSVQPDDAELDSSASSANEDPSGDAAKSSSSSLAVSDSQAYVDDDTAFEHLVAVYDSLQSYNERVYSCLQTYNGAVFASDKSQREAAAGIAKSLLAEIEKDIKILDAMNIGQLSSLYDDYQNVRRLLNDQYQRLAVVVESWDISLGYDAPYEHEDEILEPLRRDIGPSGVSTYLEDFDATYWGSRPSR